MNAPVARLDHVSRAYGSVEALRDLTLHLSPGVCYGLLGRNGAGKSTALKLLVGLLKPDRGSVLVFDADPFTRPEKAKRSVGYLAEDLVFTRGLPAVDLFRFFAGCHPTWDWGFADDLVRRFAIPVDRPLGQLSKGQQRQVGLVCAVAHRPKLLILDEPGGGLDPVVRRDFLEQVVELLGGEATTVLFSSHHLQEVERIADRVGILHEGRLLLEEDLDGLRERSCRVMAEGDLDAQAARALEGCVRAERREGSWVLTLRCTPEEGKQRVSSRLGARIRDVQPVTLEDLFVSMVG